MGTRLFCQCVTLMVCGLILAACEATPVVRVQRGDLLVYHLKPGPLESMRVAAPADAIDLEIHGDGWTQLRRAGVNGPLVCEVRLSPQQVQTLFGDMVKAGLYTLDKYKDLSTEPLLNQGQLAPEGSLVVHLTGKTYQYYWLEGDYPPAAEPVRKPLRDLIKQLSPMAKPEQ